MAFTPSFTAAQTVTKPSKLTLTDASTAVPTLTNRLVALKLANGNYLDEKGKQTSTLTYLDWAVSNNSVTYDVLTKDYAIWITVTYLNGSSVVDTKSILFNFNAYARIYRYKLLKATASNPVFLDNPNFFTVFSNITNYIIGGNEAVILASDITLAQICNNKAKYYIDNQQLSF